MSAATSEPETWNRGERHVVPTGGDNLGIGYSPFAQLDHGFLPLLAIS
jgi:hypothetical protein